tara:strand:+ start:385 stop:1539 length:1155 start_codon:yes stop_codon:yes gene_type:complete
MGYFKTINLSKLSRYFIFLFLFFLPFSLESNFLFKFLGESLIIISFLLSPSKLIEKYSKNKYYLLILFFSIYSIAISLNYNFNPSSISGPLSYFFTFGFLAPYLICQFKDDYILQKKANFSLHFGIIISSFLVILVYFFGMDNFLSEFIKLDITGGKFYRIGIGSVNDYSYIIQISIVWTLIFRRSNFKNVFNNLIFNIILIYEFFLILITGSRISFLSVIVVYLFYKSNFKNLLIKLILISSVVFLAIFFSFDNQSLMSDFSRVFNTFSLADRFSAFSDKVLNEISLFGNGVNSFQIYYENIPIHSNPILVMLETGMIGFSLIYSYFIIFSLDHLYKKNIILLFVFFINIFVITNCYQDIFGLFLSIILIPSSLKETNPYKLI